MCLAVKDVSPPTHTHTPPPPNPAHRPTSQSWGVGEKRRDLFSFLCPTAVTVGFWEDHERQARRLTNGRDDRDGEAKGPAEIPSIQVRLVVEDVVDQLPVSAGLEQQGVQFLSVYTAVIHCNVEKKKLTNWLTGWFLTPFTNIIRTDWLIIWLSWLHNSSVSYVMRVNRLTDSVSQYYDNRLTY